MIRAFERPLTVRTPQDVPAECSCTWAPGFTLLTQTATAGDGRRYTVTRYAVTSYILKHPNNACPVRSHIG